MLLTPQSLPLPPSVIIIVIICLAVSSPWSVSCLVLLLVFVFMSQNLLDALLFVHFSLQRYNNQLGFKHSAETQSGGSHSGGLLFSSLHGQQFPEY